MNIPDGFIDEIKARTRVSDIVGKHVKLKRKGREFEALSPFTNEKTPSFFVHDEKGFYHCFSSGKHGDAIQFLIEVEGSTFIEAVKTLAEMAGMEIPKDSPENERRFAHNRSLIEVMEMASIFFQKELYRAGSGKAREYVEGRGLTKTMCQNFNMGFAPPANAPSLMDHLLQAGVTNQQMIECGLVIDHKESGKIFDRFRGRLMFPISDTRGRVIAFGGRGGLLMKDKAKYMNSPETSIFDKSNVLYNLKNARQALADPYNPDRGLIVVEGYMDVVGLAAHGLDHAVAPMGTALTPQQIKMLWQAGPVPTICFDGDDAGKRAAGRAIENILPLLTPGKSVKLATLPDGKDPDDVVRDGGADAFKAILARSTPLSDALWKFECNAEPYGTPEGLAGLKVRIMERVGGINDEAVRDTYRKDMLSRIDGLYKRRRNPREISKGHINAIERSKAYDKNERRLLTAIFEWPDLLDLVSEDFFSITFKTPEYRSIQSDILQKVREGEEWIPSSYFVDVDAENKSAIRDMAKTKAITIMDFIVSHNGDVDVIRSSWMDYYHNFREKDPDDLDDALDAAILSGDREAVARLSERRKA